MAIWISKDTRLVVQGLTGREGKFHALACRDYGTQVVAGVTPGKGGTTVEGIPVFDSVAAAVKATGANASMVFVPPPSRADAIMEAADAGIELIVAITEGIPVNDMIKAKEFLATAARAGSSARTAPASSAPAKAKIGIMPARIHRPGFVGVVSRSGTLTYEAVWQMTGARLRPVDLHRHRRRPDQRHELHRRAARCSATTRETEAVIMIGEIGGSAEEEAAAWIKANLEEARRRRSSPAARRLPGRRMGHAGAIIAGGKGTARREDGGAARPPASTSCDSPALMGETLKKALGK